MPAEEPVVAPTAPAEPAKKPESDSGLDKVKAAAEESAKKAKETYDYVVPAKIDWSPLPGPNVAVGRAAWSARARGGLSRACPCAVACSSCRRCSTHSAARKSGVYSECCLLRSKTCWPKPMVNAIHTAQDAIATGVNTAGELASEPFSSTVHILCIRAPDRQGPVEPRGLTRVARASLFLAGFLSLHWNVWSGSCTDRRCQSHVKCCYDDGRQGREFRGRRRFFCDRCSHRSGWRRRRECASLHDLNINSASRSARTWCPSRKETHT